MPEQRLEIFARFVLLWRPLVAEQKNYFQALTNKGGGQQSTPADTHLRSTSLMGHNGAARGSNEQHQSLRGHMRIRSC